MQSDFGGRLRSTLLCYPAIKSLTEEQFISILKEMYNLTAYYGTFSWQVTYYNVEPATYIIIHAVPQKDSQKFPC